MQTWRWTLLLQHLYSNGLFWFPFSCCFFPLLFSLLRNSWFAKALENDLNPIIDNHFTGALYLLSYSPWCNYVIIKCNDVISWAYHRWSHQAVSEMTVSVRVYVCTSLRFGTCTLVIDIYYAFYMLGPMLSSRVLCASILTAFWGRASVIITPFCRWSSWGL